MPTERSAVLRRYDATQLSALATEAAAAPRRRKNLNLHPRLDDPVQRLFNALQPGTYACPHRHARDPGWELMLLLRGAFSLVSFEDDGQVRERVDLDAPGAIEVPARTWHTVVCRAPDTLLFEVKPGPYDPATDKEFAPFAPREGDSTVPVFLHWLLRAQPGEAWSSGAADR